jgi:hypothetical protein
LRNVSAVVLDTVLVADGMAMTAMLSTDIWAVTS